MAQGYKVAVKEIGQWLDEHGYDWEFDVSHPHPRLYFGVGEKKRFITLSTTSSNDGQKSLAHHLTRIRRELVHIPKPVKNGEQMKITPAMTAAIDKAAKTPLPDFKGPAVTTQASAPKTEQALAGANVYKDPSEKSPISWPIYVRAGGRGDGGLTIAFQEEVLKLFPGKTHAELLYVEGRSIGLAFRDGGPVRITSVPGRGTDKQAYFPRDMVPFSFVDSTANLSMPRMFAKATGDALVSTAPLPQVFLTGMAQIKGVDLAAEGIAAKHMMNEWLIKARAAGMEPVVTFNKDNGTISIQVAEKRTRSL